MKGFLDYTKKLKYNDRDEVCFTFGKHVGYSLKDVSHRDPGYFKWMLNADFHVNTKEVLKKELDALNIFYNTK
jgi:DNA polymerase-3 subunit epsilon